MHPRHTLAAGALALLAAFPAAAQTEPQGEAVVVTATRQPVRANELLNDVAVITRDDIEKAGPLQTLGELLTGKAAFARQPDDITIFDMTGIALQDLTVAQLLLDRAQKSDACTRVEWPW